jgi:endonuclease YncB( thermonuclease family)
VIRYAIAAFAALASIRCAEQHAIDVTTTSFPHTDECVNPMYESDSWFVLEGRVVEVTSGRTFRLLPDKGNVITVTLANVGEPIDPKAMALLQRMITGKRVSVMTRVSIDAPEEEIVAEVHGAKGRDISRELIRAGAAAFVVAPAYSLSAYSECLNRIAEREAKAEGAGVWHHR